VEDIPEDELTSDPPEYEEDTEDPEDPPDPDPDPPDPKDPDPDPDLENPYFRNVFHCPLIISRITGFSVRIKLSFFVYGLICLR
jgi:hypothetical protein